MNEQEMLQLRVEVMAIYDILKRAEEGKVNTAYALGNATASLKFRVLGHIESAITREQGINGILTNTGVGRKP